MELHHQASTVNLFLRDALAATYAECGATSYEFRPIDLVLRSLQSGLLRLRLVPSSIFPGVVAIGEDAGRLTLNPC
jgi:hypothetical protein